MWESDHKGGWAPNNWCFWTVVLEKTLESLLDSKEIKPVNPKGNQLWILMNYRHFYYCLIDNKSNPARYWWNIHLILPALTFLYPKKTMTTIVPVPWFQSLGFLKGTFWNICLIYLHYDIKIFYLLELTISNGVTGSLSPNISSRVYAFLLDLTKYI